MIRATEEDRELTTSSSSRATWPSLHVSSHPLVRHKLALLANERTDSKTFRELARELTTLLIYEATIDLPLSEFTYRTPMESTTGTKVAIRVGLVPILRAGLGMVDAAADVLPKASVWHLGMYRDEASHRPVSYYNRLPETCPDDLVIVLDPMLATGGSAIDAIRVLKEWGAWHRSPRPIRTSPYMSRHSTGSSTRTSSSGQVWATRGTVCSGHTEASNFPIISPPDAASRELSDGGPGMPA